MAQVYAESRGGLQPTGIATERRLPTATAR
jgi:hypothetical protein